MLKIQYFLDFCQNKGGGGAKHNISTPPVHMPLIYAIQQASNKMNLLVQAANDVYLTRLEDFTIII